MTLKSDAKFEGKLASGLKKDMRIWQIFTRVLKSVKIGTLIRYFCSKSKMYELNIYSGVMRHDKEKSCKI